MVTEASGQTEPAAVVTPPAAVVTPPAATPGADDAAAKAAADKAAADKAAADAAAQTPEAKAAAEAKAKAEADAKAKQGAPEKYADFKLPDGVTLDPEVMGEFSTVAKELNLTQEAAQKLADIGAKMSQKTATTITAAIEKQKADWTEASKTDKEFGGEKFAENLGLANAALKQFAGPEFIKFLADSGLSQHPEMIRTFIKVSKAISSDTVVAGHQSAGIPDAAAKLFDKRIPASA